MKKITTYILIFFTSLSFSQILQEVKTNNKTNYSENSEIKVIYNEYLNKFHPNTKPVGIFVNGIFMGNLSMFNLINSKKIDSLKIEKESFQKNGIEYFGKIQVKMQSDYVATFITLKELVEKYLELDSDPLVFQINEDVINKDYNGHFVDENFILKIVLNKIKTSKKDSEINLIKLITKTPENIKKANTIRIKGTGI